MPILVSRTITFMLVNSIALLALNAEHVLPPQSPRSEGEKLEIARAAKDIKVLQREYLQGKTLPGVDRRDLPLLQFGQVFLVPQRATANFYDPHATLVYAIARCISGGTNALLREMSEVEGAKSDLGVALSDFVKEFGPDLQRYKKDRIAVRFLAYRLRETTSVWYYALTDYRGVPLAGRPWLSLHRSRTTGRCALTGIFLSEKGELVDPMPRDLVTSLPASR
jgi:hypothetical protein